MKKGSNANGRVAVIHQKGMGGGPDTQLGASPGKLRSSRPNRLKRANPGRRARASTMGEGGLFLTILRRREMRGRSLLEAMAAVPGGPDRVMSQEKEDENGKDWGEI